MVNVVEIFFNICFLKSYPYKFIFKKKISFFYFLFQNYQNYIKNINQKLSRDTRLSNKGYISKLRKMHSNTC